MSLSCVFFARTFRMFSGTALILAALLVLPGCWVSSINPLYEETTIDNLHVVPDDVVFDPSLIGSWTTTDDKCPTQLTIAAKGQIYDLQLVEQGEGCIGADKPSRYQARLVKLDTHYFMDVAPTDDAVCDMCAAKHDILLLKLDKATLAFTPINSDWLKKSIEAKTVTLSTVAGDTDTITASSKDLKAFCRQFADDKEAFKTESALMFKRKPAS
jgi:hypothetical protein